MFLIESAGKNLLWPYVPLKNYRKL
jgi:hypothetical protein